MNCKPGDLAVIVRSLTSSQERNLGHICRCVAPAMSPWGEPGWRIEPPTPLGQHHAVDVALRPLRDPGDDALDEMLRPLPEEVAA